MGKKRWVATLIQDCQRHPLMSLCVCVCARERNTHTHTRLSDTLSVVCVVY